MKKTTKHTRRITIKQSLAQIAGKGPKQYPHYTGAPIAATPGEVWKRDMPEFKNCRAECWLVINRAAGTYTFMNVYNDKLKSSFRPEIMTYPIKDEKVERKLAAKIADMQEVPPTDWPTFLTAADHVAAKPARRGRKTAAK